MQIIVSRYFGCGITLDQYVRCWGENAPKVGGLYTQITASDNFACGVLVDGRVNCWGSYSFPLPSSEKKFVQISCGSTHCCALDPRGTFLSLSNLHNLHRTIGLAHCWGWRTVGPIVSYDPPLAELFTDENGNQYFRTNKELTVSSSTYDADEEEEATLPRHQPTLVPIQFKQISVGTHYACGIQYMDGKIRCWGNLKSILKGTDLVDLNAPYRQVSVGNSGVCMISEDTNHVSCLGIAPLSESTEWDQIKVGYYHVCGVTMDSELKCSGPAHPIVNSLRDDFVVA